VRGVGREEGIDDVDGNVVKLHGAVKELELFSSVGVAVFVLVLAGGGLYTLGALACVLRRPDPAPAVFGFRGLPPTRVAAAGVRYIAVFFVVGAA
jgi:predicted membrane channel-forming protein YqfA (hemolysin III family)